MMLDDNETGGMMMKLDVAYFGHNPRIILRSLRETTKDLNLIYMITPIVPHRVHVYITYSSQQVPSSGMINTN
jgi:hypothetical protein